MLLAQRQTACGVSLAVYLGGLFKSRQHAVAFEDDGACRTGSREHASRRPANSLPCGPGGRAGCAHGGRHARPRARPTRPLQRRRCRSGSDAGLADRTGASSPPMHRPDFRKSDGRPISRPRRAPIVRR